MPAGFLGFVDDVGHFALDDWRGFLAYAARRFRGREIVVTVKRRPRPQGDQVMRYYRGVVVPDIADASGVLDPEEFENVHNGLAWKFLRLPDGPMGEPRRRSTSKSDLSAEEMSRYVDDCILWAETSIPGCHVRRPHEVDVERVYAPVLQ